MLLEHISAQKFRSLAGELDLGPGLNILVGENGQGKTNWLEAIFILANARSFKTAKLNEAVRFGEDLGVVRGRVRRSEEIRRELQVAIERNIKILSVNGKRTSSSGYLGELHAVMFNSETLQVVRGGPEERRKYLDECITGVHPPYVRTLADHSRVLKQRNSLLQNARDKEFSVERTAGLLEPWNEQLTVLSEKIHRARIRMVERLNQNLEDDPFGSEKIFLRYASSLEGKGDLADYKALISERLRLRVQAELAAGYSLIGPHRDELEITSDGQELRKFGSSGQQRSAMLRLQMANIAVFHSIHNEFPLFLLDDIDAELDYRRIGRLFEYLEGKTQTVVTTSKESMVSQFGTKGAVMDVVSGSSSARHKMAASGPSALT